MTRWRLLAQASSTLLALGCQAEAFPCTTDTQCGGAGVCSAPGYCSFPADDCGSGLRFGDGAGGFAGQCVPEDEIGGTTTGGPEPDSTTSTTAAGTTVTTDATTSTTADATAGDTEDPVLDPDVPADTDPPTLISTQWLPSGQILLTFSEPLDPNADPHPSRFRLSVAYYEYDYYLGYGYTYYNDAGIDAYYNGPLEIESVSPGSSPSELVLTLDGAIDSGGCYYLGYYNDIERPLHVHYASSLPIPDPVRDPAGNELGALAEHWVLNGGETYAYAYGDHPEIDPVQSLSCYADG